MKVGVFGGTFDPVHKGHVAVAREVLDKMNLDAIRMVPCNRSPHKQRDDLTPGADRLAMLALATQDDQNLVPSSVELTRPGPSYTIDTLGALREQEPGNMFFFIMGMDSFLEIESWKDFGLFLQDTHVVVVNRPGCEPPDLDRLPEAVREEGRMHLIEVAPQGASATEIRRKARNREDLGALVPPQVDRYIRKCALYR